MKRTLGLLLVTCSLGAQAFTPGPTPSTGALDPSFGLGGVQYTNFAGAISGMAGVTGMALQADGKLVVVGNGVSESGGITLVARFNANGTLDATFNSTGFVTSLPGLPTLNAVAIQADGKIVVAGVGAGPHVALARVNANGSVDTGFNGTGGVSTTVGTSSVAYAVAIQADGKIVVAGHASTGGGTDFALVRYNANGSLDTSFSGDGIVTTAIGSGNDIAYAIAIQPDGKIVAGGSAVGATEDFAVARYDTAGSLDSTFNGTGFAVQDFGGGADSIRALRIAPDGKIVAAGSALIATASDFALARYNTNGTPDATFNGTGRVVQQFIPAGGSADGANALAVLADGRIVAAGYYTSGVSFVAMMQFTAAGALDASFVAGSGKFTTSQGAPSGLGAVAVQPDGKIVAAGYAGTGKDLFLLRTDAAGNLDGSFGTTGFASLPASQLSDAAYAVAIQVDGKIVAAGAANRVSFAPDPLALARYNTGGTLDTGFGSSGRATNDVSMVFPNSNAHAYGMAIQNDGRVVVAGDWGYQPTGTGAVPVRNFVVARYTTGGVAEATVQTTLETYSVARAARVQADGRIVATGFTQTFVTFQPPGQKRFALARYNAGDLSLDTGFNGTGKVVTPVGTGDAEANAMAIQADGSIVAVGYAFQATDRQFAVVRYSAAGVAQPAILTDIGLGTSDIAHAVAIQPDGYILVGGAAGTDTALARYTPSLGLDGAFGGGSGRFLFPGAPIVSVALQTDGKILALTRDFHVWRLTTAGVPDTTFGVAGRVVMAMGPGSAAGALALQADGRIVVVGNADGGLGQDFVVARINPATALTLMPAAASYDFGGQSMNTTHPSATVTVTNPGLPVQVSSVTTSGDFAVASNGCGLVPGSGTPCPIGVTFRPTSEGSIRGTLLVEYLPRPGAIAITLNGTGERSLVTHYYRSILGRDPDAGGKAYWDGEATRVSTLGANVNETWFALAQAFYTSAEYAAFNRDNAGYATDLYNTFFNRAPDSGGLAFWKGQLDAGLPREVLLAQFMFSPEFTAFSQAIFGTPLTRAEVNAVTDFYRGLLARLPDSTGFNHWVSRFRTAQCQGQAAIVTAVEEISSAFALSGEYAARGRTASQYVGDLYNAFLRRGGDLAGVQHWINQITSGALTREQVRVAFRDSPEFQARVNAIIQQGCLP